MREFVDECFGDIRAKVRPHTAASYDYAIRAHILEEFGPLRLFEITTGKVNRWSARLISQGYSGATVNGYVDIVRLLLGYAFRWDILEVLPIKASALDRYKVNLPCNELSSEEEQRFLAAFDNEAAFRKWIERHMPRGHVRQLPRAKAKPKLFGAKRVYGAGIRHDSDAAGEYYRRFRAAKPLFVAALECGLRRGDLLSMRWHSVDWETGTLAIVTGKTQRRTFIPLSESVRETLQECRSRSVVGTYVFADADGNPYPEKTIVRYFAIAKALAGFSDRALRFHDLRHSFASKLAREGVNLEFIAGAMGHSSNRQTARYARPGATAIESVKSALDRARVRRDREASTSRSSKQAE